MGRRRSAALVAAAASAVVAAAVVTAAPAPAATTADWAQYMDGSFHQSAGQQGAITPATVASLHGAWHLAAGDTVDASVSVVGNRAFVVGRNAVVYAVNAATGAVQWQKQLDAGSTAVCALKGPLATPAVLGVGGAFDVMAGFVPRAPRLMQEAGLEWAWRLAMEPRKLFKRYLVTNSAFIALLGKTLATRRFALRRR